MVTHIQIGDVTPRIQYEADGVQDTFTFPFPVFAGSDVHVFIEDVRQETGYSVTGAGESAGGEVTFAVPPQAGAVVTLTRRLSIARLSDFQESGELRARVLNDELDYLTAALQQVAEGLDRAPHLALTETVDADMTLPSPVPDRVVMWNGTGNGLVNGPQADVISQAQSDAYSAAESASQAAQSETGAATSATAAANSAQAAATAASSNMYATNENKASDFAVASTDDGKQFLVDTSSGPVTVTLPEGANATDGFRVAFAKVTPDGNAVIVNRSGTDTINGGATWQFSIPYGQSVVTLDTTPSPDTWFAVGVGVTSPVGVGDLHENARPYDIAFVAGFDSIMRPDPIAVQAYGELVVPRELTLTGETGYIDIAPTGAAAVVDIEKNGASIYGTKPQFADGANTMSAGVLSTTALVAGDRLSFKITQTGVGEAGQGLRFTLKASLA